MKTVDQFIAHPRDRFEYREPAAVSTPASWDRLSDDESEALANELFDRLDLTPAYMAFALAGKSKPTDAELADIGRILWDEARGLLKDRDIEP